MKVNSENGRLYPGGPRAWGYWRHYIKKREAEQNAYYKRPQTAKTAQRVPARVSPSRVKGKLQVKFGKVARNGIYANDCF